MVDGILHVWVTAAPAEGGANRELVKAVASWMQVPVSAVRLVAGQTGRRKLLQVDGAAPLPDGWESPR